MVDTGAVNLGSAYGEFLVDTSRVEQQLNTAFGRMDQHAGNLLTRVGDKLQGVGDKITGWGVAITKFMAPVGVALGIGIKTFGTFEDALAEIKARTGATAEQMAAVQAKALEMGAATKYSSTQAAEAMLQLLSSGYDLNETFAALPAVLDAAAAGGMDLGYTADVVTDALAMWNLGAKDAGRVSDALARGAAASSAEINDLAQGLGNVGPLASEMGLSIEDTIAILAAFSERGIKGAEAGTALRSMLTHMTDDSAPVTAAWKKLGISLYDSTGTIRPLNTVLGEMREKMKGLTDEERNQVVKDLAGAYGQLGLTVLTSSDAMGDMSSLMGQQADASTVAAARMDTLNGKLESAKGSLEALMIVGLGPYVEQYLKPALDRTITFVNLLTTWAQANPELTMQIVHLLVVLATMGTTLIGVGKTISLVGKAVTLLGSPLGWIILVAGLLYKAWSKNFLGLQDLTKRVVQFVTDIIHNDLWEELSGLWDAIQVGNLEGTLSGIGDLFGAVIGVIQSYGPQVQTALSGFLQTALDWIQQNAPVLIAGLLAWGVALVAWIEPQIPVLLAQLMQLAGQVWTWIAAQAPGVLAQLMAWGQAFIAWIGPQIPPLLAQLLQLAGQVLGWIAAQVPGVVNQLLAWGRAFIDWVGPQIPPLLAQLLILLNRLIEWVSAQLPGIGAKLEDWGQSFIDWVIPAAEGLLLSLPGLIADVLKWILDVTPDIIAQMLEWATAFISFVGPLVVDIVVELAKVSGAVIEWVIGEFIPKIIEEIPGIVLAFLKFCGEITTKVGPELVKFLAEIVRFILFDLIPGLATAVQSIGESIVNGIRRGIDNVWDSFTSYLEDKIKGGVVGDVADFLGIGSPSKVFAGFGENIVQGLVQGLGKLDALDLALGNMTATLLAPVNAPMPAVTGAGMGGNVTNYFQVGLQITPDTLQRYPQAVDYGRDAAQEFVKQLKAAQVKAGGGIVG